ncbi:MAG: hypothetical protein ACTSSB_15075, partial [Candidatus Heimdallarchaeota archaeon]
SSILDNPAYIDGNVVFTIFNATVNSSMSVIYLDSLEYNLIGVIFDLWPKIPFVTYGFSVFSSIFICVIVFIRKRK